VTRKVRNPQDFLIVTFTLFGLRGSNIIHRLVHLGDNVEPVEDVEGLGTLFASHTQIGLPHVRADKLDLCRQLRADHGKETLEGFHGTFLADPQQPGTAHINLIHQGRIFVPFGILNLVHANGTNRRQDSMLQPKGDQIGHRIMNFIPGGAKRFGGLFPREFAGPMPQEMHVNLGRGVFARAPRNCFDYDPALLAIDAPHEIDRKDEIAPNPDKLKPPRRARPVVPG
jgi:hypothetical protein